jgi:hypothetical protein
MRSRTTYYILMAFVCAGVLALFALISMEMDKRAKASDELMEQVKKQTEEHTRDTTPPQTIDSSTNPAPGSHIKI